jgi:hypothetical protein
VKEGVEVGEDVPPVVGEDVRTVQRADAVDDVDGTRKNEQRCREKGPTDALHRAPPQVDDARDAQHKRVQRPGNSRASPLRDDYTVSEVARA